MGYAVFRIWPGPASRLPPRLPVLLPAVIFLSLLPDADAVVGLLLGNMGRYHNNFMGSPLFGVLAALVVAGAIRLVTGARFGFWFGLTLICYELHVLMDYLTVGRGVMLLWPFSSERFSPPANLFYGLRWSDGLVSQRHLWTLLTELAFAVVLVGLLELGARARRARS
jgi:membrane-bound metal-dependent hydrolase YbcI (DUF457 family)